MRFPDVAWDAPVSAEVVRSWQERLDRIAPPVTGIHTTDGQPRPSWLKLVWLPGFPWQPIERWIVYNMQAPGADKDRDNIPDNLQLFWDGLRGPDPARFTYFDKTRHRVVRTRNCGVDRYQWRLFRETGCFGYPLWVIQGEHGGHLREWGDTESSISQMNGGPAQPPRIGELPYAPFDERVCDQLRHLDKFAVYRDCIDFCDRSPDQLEAEERAHVAGMRAHLWKWLGAQIGETVDEFANSQIDYLLDNASDERVDIDMDEAEHNFIYED